jgi:hypothetical protein
MEGKERRRTICYEERETIEHMWNGERGRERNGEKYRRKWKGDKMNERDMKAEGQNGKKRVGIRKKIVYYYTSLTRRCIIK